MINIIIDGKKVQVEEKTSIIEAANGIGIDIPNFCYDKELTSFGGCRICVVEVEGARNLMAACSTEVTEGMIIQTESKKVIETRKNLLDLILSNHPQDCLTCSKVGECKLQEYCIRYGIKESSFIGEKKNHQIDDLNPVMERDQNKCILCGKCVRVCKEVQVTGTIEFTGRGFNSKVTTAFDDSIDYKNCRMCGQCISVCPTGALVNKQLKNVRPWEVTKVRTTCPFCGTGCNFDLNIKGGKVVGVTPTDNAPVNESAMCVKGRYHIDIMNSPDRLTKPLIKKDGTFIESSWDEALSLIVRKINDIREKHGADALAGLSSARCVNEDNYVFQKVMRVAMGTNNVDHCARTCHAPTVAGLATTLGDGAMTNSIGEVVDNEVLFIIGCNATEAHPIIGNKMKQAARKGSKLIVVDPRRTELAEMATLYLPLQSGTDAALVNGMINIIVNEGWHDDEYIKTRCEGFENMWDTVKGYTPDVVERITGIPKGDLYEAARLYTGTKKAGIFYTLGITEHTTGTANVMNLANLAMVTGHLGIENAGINPLRGQNNVQGSCDMGALPNNFPGYKDVSDLKNLEFFEKAWGAKLRSEKGLRIPEMIDGASDGTLKFMYVMGEDPVLTDPDANHIKAALKKLDFLVVQDIFLSEIATYADVILPATCYGEKDGTFTNTERRVQRVRKAVNPPGRARLDWEILCDIANRLGHDINYSSAEDIFNEIRRTIPSYAGITYERLDEGGIQWPCPTVEHPGTKFLHKGKFSRGLGLMLPVEYEPPAELVCEEYPTLLATGRMLYHYCITTRHLETLMKIRPHELAEINPIDAEKLGVKEEEFIRVTSRRGSILTRVTITERVKPGMMFMTFHYKESPVNELTNSAFDPVTKTPEYKITAVKIEKLDDKEEVIV
ncbi:NADP-dependent formate dehydrogenase FdhA [Gottschalkia acidurici 9a]|uniref:NADP-dependent formate dehydrogenase FdhA n=1 Tax=Gottschalkia acidurici (strain ATCC 7906 / DSM 604 / BCRC 14475 / CIP 104303 / KCTC 5404 / NCIMB 10678 / 9a) TaxID=1128398 RepID=K0AZH6_GOTA9|nr:formate dehydrogenase subunit alpha [Gottschalkia acidurici]AFS78674.1 NADP-dependent formate dehydrogenase FdhA [Gottschalkia acidurici 9a]